MSPTIEYYQAEVARLDAEKAELKRVARENADIANERGGIIVSLRAEIEALKSIGGMVPMDSYEEQCRQASEADDRAEQSRREMVALALECEEKTEALRMAEFLVRGGDKTAALDVLRQFDRPASFWTRKAEAMGACVKQLRLEHFHDPKDLKLCTRDSCRTLAALDSISEGRPG